MQKLNVVDTIALVLVILGGLNWGLIGLGNWNVVDMVFGMSIARLIYVLVGIAAVYVIWLWTKMEKM